jgi:NADH-quinone oxidoreductase subunit M
VFLIATLAALGLPGLNSFAGEFLAFLGAFRWNIVLGGLGTMVVVPAAWYMLRFFQGAMEGPPHGVAPTVVGARTGTGDGATMEGGAGAGDARAGGLVDLRWGEVLVLLPLLALIVYLGFAPGVLTSRIERNLQLPASLQARSAPPLAGAQLQANGKAYLLVRAAHDA